MKEIVILAVFWCLCIAAGAVITAALTWLGVW